LISTLQKMKKRTVFHYPRATFSYHPVEITLPFFGKCHPDFSNSPHFPSPTHLPHHTPNCHGTTHLSSYTHLYDGKFSTPAGPHRSVCGQAPPPASPTAPHPHCWATPSTLSRTAAPQIPCTPFQPFRHRNQRSPENDL